MTDRYVFGETPHLWTNFKVDGVLMDPTHVVLTVILPDETTKVYAYPSDPVLGPSGDIVRESLGVYYVDEPATQLGAWIYRFVSDAPAAGASEGEYIVYSLVQSGLSFLDTPEDDDAVRYLLGLEEADITNDVIESLVFAQEAEFRVKALAPTWAAILTPSTGDPDPTLVRCLRVATIYATTALIAESKVQGGTIGEVRPPFPGEVRDWKAFARTMWDHYGEYIGILAQATAVDAGVTDIYYDLPGVVVGGPTRLRNVALGIPYPLWVNYPPVIGAPPGFPTWWKWSPEYDN